MKKIIEVNRQLAGVEDFLWGEGTVTQTRGGKEVEVTRINAMKIPYGNITIGEAIAGGIQGLGIFTTSSSLVKNGSVSIYRSTVNVPTNKVIQVDDLILDAFYILGKVTTLEDDTITVEFYATVKGDKGAKGDKGDKGAAGTITWAGITGKPTTFAPPSATQTVIGGAKMHVASGVLYITTT